MTNYDERPERVLPEGLNWGATSWRGRDYVDPDKLHSSEGWSLLIVRTDVENGSVRWLYSSPEIEFECLGKGYSRSLESVIPRIWRVICVGIVPGAIDVARLPRESGPLVEQHCRNVKLALPYWGAKRELGFMPEARIDDPYWPIKL
jgi:hypothetical protein